MSLISVAMWTMGVNLSSRMWSLHFNIDISHFMHILIIMRLGMKGVEADKM